MWVVVNLFGTPAAFLDVVRIYDLVAALLVFCKKVDQNKENQPMDPTDDNEREDNTPHEEWAHEEIGNEPVKRMEESVVIDIHNQDESQSQRTGKDLNSEDLSHKRRDETDPLLLSKSKHEM